MDDLPTVAGLHALAFCERLFYFEEVERIRVADRAVFAGHRLHEEIAQDLEGEWERPTLQDYFGRVPCRGEVQRVHVSFGPEPTGSISTGRGRRGP